MDNEAPNDAVRRPATIETASIEDRARQRGAVIAKGKVPALDIATRYTTALIFGTPAAMCFLALRMGSDGIGWTRPAMYMAVIALLVNILGNYVFMYGKFGLPRLGAVGCGVATALTQTLIFIAMWGYVANHERYRQYAPLAHFDWPRRERLLPLLRLGRRPTAPARPGGPLGCRRR